MGCYDTIRIKNVICNKCGKENDEFDFQTKDLGKGLSTYYFPCYFSNTMGPRWNLVHFDDPEEEGFIGDQDLEINIYGSCMHCQQFQGGTGFIKKKVLYKYDISSKEHESKKEIPLSPEFIEILAQAQQDEEDLKQLRQAFSGLLVAVMSGEDLDEEKAAQIDKLLQLDAVKNRSIGKLEPSDMSLFGYAKIVYELIKKK